MSHFLDRLKFLTASTEKFADGHGEVRSEDRSWEDAYRQRWSHDKIVRSTPAGLSLLGFRDARHLL